jgi:hypothetical protein
MGPAPSWTATYSYGPGSFLDGDIKEVSPEPRARFTQDLILIPDAQSSGIHLGCNTAVYYFPKKNRDRRSIYFHTPRSMPMRIYIRNSGVPFDTGPEGPDVEENM